MSTLLFHIFDWCACEDACEACQGFNEVSIAHVIVRVHWHTKLMWALRKKLPKELIYRGSGLEHRMQWAGVHFQNDINMRFFLRWVEQQGRYVVAVRDHNGLLALRTESKLRRQMETQCTASTAAMNTQTPMSAPPARGLVSWAARFVQWIKSAVWVLVFNTTKGL